MRHVDHISEADADNDKCKLLNVQVPAIDFSGGGTHTADALKQAQVGCCSARNAQNEIDFMARFHCIAEHSNESSATQQENYLPHNGWIFEWRRSNANR